MEDLPTFSEYKAQVDALVSRGELSLEQGILLCQCFKAYLRRVPYTY